MNLQSVMLQKSSERLPLLESNQSVVSAFPTFIFQHRWPDRESIPVNTALKEEILTRQAHTPGIELSNVGGWQSSPDLLMWKIPQLKPFRHWIHQAYGITMCRMLGTTSFKSRYATIAWANVNGVGHYNRTHIHSNAHWSGVYYVDPGQLDPSTMPNGALELLDPRPAVGVFDLPGITSSGTWTITPQAGMMLLFPSWLRHSVLPYHGRGPRISISFNLCVRELSLDDEPIVR